MSNMDKALFSALYVDHALFTWLTSQELAKVRYDSGQYATLWRKKHGT